MIPEFSASNVLPPFVGTTPDNRAAQSPFIATMVELVERFATSSERCAILWGLLDFRKLLLDLGYCDGYQWIDGSFVENVEVTRRRPPSDADIVTVSYRPSGMSEADFVDFASNHRIFDRNAMKIDYKLDAIFIDLDVEAHLMVEDFAFYFSLFAHQRTTFLWKGMLKIPLVSNDDEARIILAGLEANVQAA